MSAQSTEAQSLATLQDDMIALKRDVTSLLQHLQQGATDGAQSTVEHLDHATRAVYRNLTDSGVRSAKEIGRQVEAKPVAAILVALGIGYIGGRLLSR